MSPSTMKRQDATTRRAQLLDATDEVFTAHGVSAPLKLVVEHAGVGRATLYRQFPNRHAILLALMERSAQRMQDRAGSLKDRPDAFFALLEYLGERIVRSPAMPDYWRTTSLNDPRFAPERQQVWDAFAPALVRAQANGLVRSDVQTRDLSPITGMLGAALRGNTDAECRLLVPQALDIVCRGLRTDAASSSHAT